MGQAVAAVEQCSSMGQNLATQANHYKPQPASEVQGALRAPVPACQVLTRSYKQVVPLEMLYQTCSVPFPRLMPAFPGTWKHPSPSTHCSSPSHARVFTMNTIS